MHPRDASRLEPLLRTALRLGDSFAIEPPASLVEGRRERLLNTAFRSLDELVAEGPRPSFVLRARRRFQAAAQLMAERRHRLSLPAWNRSPYLRPLAGAMATVLLAFSGFGVFAVITAGDALPGDWQYPVKRMTEDVRLTLAFSDDAKRSVKLDVARERLTEIEKLAEKGKPIGGDLLQDLKGQTDSLVSQLNPSAARISEANEIAELAKEQQEVLGRVESLVAPEAQEQLKAAQAGSDEAYAKAAQAFALALLESEREVDHGDEGESVLAGKTPETGMIATVPPQTPTIPHEEPTESSEPEAEPTNEPSDVIEREISPEDEVPTNGYIWDLVSIGQFSVEVPGESTGWTIDGMGSGQEYAVAPNLLRLISADGASLIVVNPRNGDTYWYEFKDGSYQDFIVRITVGDVVWRADEASIRTFHASNADIVLHMLDTIFFAPPPTATPPPTDTPVPPTNTPVPGLDAGATTLTPLP